MSLFKFGIKKLLLFTALCLLPICGWAQAMDTVSAKSGIDPPRGTEGTGENRYDVRREETEARSLPATTGTGDDVAQDRQKKRDLTGFWVTGILINIVVMSAFVVWAVGQWRKSGR